MHHNENCKQETGPAWYYKVLGEPQDGKVMYGYREKYLYDNKAKPKFSVSDNLLIYFVSESEIRRSISRLWH